MKFRHLLLIPIFIIALQQWSCDGKKDSSKDLVNGEDLIHSLDSLFTELSKVDLNTVESSETIVAINEKIRRNIENVQSQRILKELSAIYRDDEHDFKFALSKDGKLGVFSYYTMMDNSGIGIKNIALYNTDNKISPTSLYGKPVIYSKIHQIKSNTQNTIYILHGNGKTHNNETAYRLHAYSLKDGDLVETPAFPLNSSSMSTTQQVEDIDSKLKLDFEVSKNGLQIRIPEATDSAVVNRTLAFNGKVFAPK